MRQLMRPLICSNVLALRLALVVGISFLACNTFSSKLILTSHESLTYFLYFFPTLVTWGFCFGSLSMLIFIQLSTKGTKSYPEKKTWSTHARQFPTHHSNLLTSAAIRDDLFYPWQCAALLMGIQSIKRWTLYCTCVSPYRCSCQPPLWQLFGIWGTRKPCWCVSQCRCLHSILIPIIVLWKVRFYS